MKVNAKQRILITGGTGFFGKTLLAEWKEKPRPQSEVLILSRDSRGFLAHNPEFQYLPGISFIEGDVRNFSFPAGEFTSVIHVATPATTQIENTEMASIILDGTRHILEFCKSREVQKLLYISSGAVYGAMPPEMERMHESLHCKPVSCYGQSKLAAEKLCLESGIACAIARCFAFVGEYLPLDRHFAIGNFIRNCLQNRPIVIQGDGSALRSYLYGKDLVEALWALLECKKPAAIVNIGSDQAISIRELAEVVRQCAKSEEEIVLHNAPDAQDSSKAYIPDVTLARQLLKLREPTPLREAVRRVLEFHRGRGNCKL